MRPIRILLTFQIGLLALTGASVPLAAQTESTRATIRIDLKEEKAPVPRTLYGIFMEEISHAFDGGIYAELIQNRSFEEGGLPPGMRLVTKKDGKLKMELESLPDGVPTNKWDMPWPWMMNCGWDTNRALLGWTLLNEGGARGEMKLTEANPMNTASSRSLAMTIAPADKPEGRVALVNSGYWGINAQAGTSYELKFYLRPETFEGTLIASLESNDGKVLARHDFGAVKPEAAWKKFNATLMASGTDPKARFVLSFRGKGSLQVDWVSLFPPTYKNRPNGLRLDLSKLLEELKPSFIRYPGGCYVEGLSWASAPDWRKMVCPPEERPGQWGYWQYRSTDGFGYHEFPQFCEDIGSDALYVAFAGMTVHPDNNWPLDEIEPVIQQTLDAIDYALGPTDSKWGAVRAKMGHPQPFPLKYVEVGNEHPPALYGDYYKKFREVIKAKYPGITVIMSMYWSGLNPGAITRAGDENIDMVDEHAYRDAAWIRTNFDYFDKYKRRPWTIYIGEYASHHGGGDWYGGLSDSVYLMMVERNGDLVKMASYAPLFCNVNKRDWGINLIEYDSSRSYAHASYYVQRLFTENRPEVNLATTFDVESKLDPTRPLMAGKFGLGSWHTETEFKEPRRANTSANCIVSVLMLREGWDVQNVTVIVGLRPYSAKANILPEQTIGRGLRLMFRGTGSGYVERVDVIGNGKFIEFVEQLEREEELNLETFEVGKDRVVIVTIAPDPKKKDADIAVPFLSPILTRKKSLAEEIASLDVMGFKCPVLPKRSDDKKAQVFRYEGYDIITLQKLIERDYRIPEPQTAEEVIGYYARRIAQDVKLPSQFAALAPKVRVFLQEKAFGETVDLRQPAMVKAISSNVAQYVTVKTFVEALRKLVVSELQPQLLNAGRPLSETPAFPWSRPTLAARKCIYNLVPCDNEFEKEFAKFLQRSDDVERFAKLPQQFAFTIEYTDNVGNLRYYEPDFVAVTTDGRHYLVETKGLEDVNVAFKDRAAHLWCENASGLTGAPWAYVKVLQKDFNELQPEDFAALLVLRKDLVG